MIKYCFAFSLLSVWPFDIDWRISKIPWINCVIIIKDIVFFSRYNGNQDSWWFFLCCWCEMFTRFLSHVYHTITFHSNRRFDAKFVTQRNNFIEFLIDLLVSLLSNICNNFATKCQQCLPCLANIVFFMLFVYLSFFLVKQTADKKYRLCTLNIYKMANIKMERVLIQ